MPIIKTKHCLFWSKKQKFAPPGDDDGLVKYFRLEVWNEAKSGEIPTHLLEGFRYAVIPIGWEKQDKDPKLKARATPKAETKVETNPFSTPFVFQCILNEVLPIFLWIGTEELHSNPEMNARLRCQRAAFEELVDAEAVLHWADGPLSTSPAMWESQFEFSEGRNNGLKGRFAHLEGPDVGEVQEGHSPPDAPQELDFGDWLFRVLRAEIFELHWNRLRRQRLRLEGFLRTRGEAAQDGINECLKQESKNSHAPIRVISLLRREDRMVSMERKLAAEKIFSYQRLVATDGRALTSESVWPELFVLTKGKSWRNKYGAHNYRRGELGCAHSHCRIWCLLEAQSMGKSSSPTLPPPASAVIWEKIRHPGLTSGSSSSSSSSVSSSSSSSLSSSSTTSSTEIKDTLTKEEDQDQNQDQRAPYWLVLEDDVTFAPEFGASLRKLEKSIRESENRVLRQDWDVVFLGWHDSTVRAEDDEEVIPKYLYKFGGGVRWAGAGMFAYMIHERGAKKLLEIARKEHIQQAIDWFLFDNFHRINAYYLQSDIVFSQTVQVSGDSDIQLDLTTL